MKLVSPSEKRILIGPNSPINFVTDLITQVESGSSLVIQRAAAYKSHFVKNPVVVISINPYDLAGNLQLSYLRNLLCQSEIHSYDSYTVGGEQSDPFNVDAYLLANKGRLVFDLKPYATAEIRLKIVSRFPARFNLSVKTEIYDAD